MQDGLMHNIWLSIGGAGALMIAISGWISKLIAERIISRWKNSADRELEGFKSELAKSQALTTGIYTQYINGYHHGQERRIQAIDVLWANLLHMADYVDKNADLIYNVLSVNEVHDFWTRQSDNPIYQQQMEVFTRLSANDVVNNVFLYDSPVSLERPFLGEKIFSWYTYYKIFLGRIINLIINGTEKRKFIHWQEDIPLVSLLKSVLSKVEFDYVMLSPYNGFKLIRNLFEVKLLEEINQVISGRTATENALELVKKYAAAEAAAKNQVLNKTG